MPVIVIGADTTLGRCAVEALLRRQGEVRAFVTDPKAAAELRRQGAKVAAGDVSDGSHVVGAALQCFSAVLIAEAAGDERERSFATGPAAVLDQWAEALAEAGVQRAIWAGERSDAADTPESALVDVAGRAAEDIAAEIAALDEAPAI